MRQRNIYKKKKTLSDAIKKNKPQLKEENKIYLLINNLYIKRPIKTLSYRKINLFFIKIIKKL